MKSDDNLKSVLTNLKIMLRAACNRRLFYVFQECHILQTVTNCVVITIAVDLGESEHLEQCP